jgi:phage terminase small subunit
MARPKKSHSLKLISGSRRLERTPPSGGPFLPLDRPPHPPGWLVDTAALAEWHRLASLLTVNRLLAETDLSTLGHLCAIHGKMVTLWRAGETPTGHFLAQYHALTAAFGLTPSTRGRLPPTLEPRDNAFDRFLP